MSNYPTPKINEVNPLHLNSKQWADHIKECHKATVYWNDSRLVEITRMRFLSDLGFPMWDLSYCQGEYIADDGQIRPCNVSLPFHQLRKRFLWSDIKVYAKKDGVNLGHLNVWPAISKLS